MVTTASSVAGFDLTRGMDEMEKGQTPKKAGGRWAVQTLMEWYQLPLQNRTSACLLCIAWG